MKNTVSFINEMETKMDDTLKGIGLTSLEINAISKSLGWDIVDVLECEDYHIEGTVEDMINYIYEDKQDVLNDLKNLSIDDVQKFSSLYEALILSKHNVFNTSKGVLFIYE